MMIEPIRRPTPEESCQWLPHGVRSHDWSKHRVGLAARGWREWENLAAAQRIPRRFVIVHSDGTSLEEPLRNLAARLDSAAQRLDDALGELRIIADRLADQQEQIDDIKKVIRSG